MRTRPASPFFFWHLILYSWAAAEVVVEQDTGEKLFKYWEAYRDTMVIGPCEAWVEASRSETKHTRNQTIALAKSEICNKNALSGALAGATPIPFVDILAGLLASFNLQARGACIVAKLRGYDVHDEETQTMMLLALGGETCAELTRQAAQRLATVGGAQAGKKALQRLPNQFFKEINKKLWPLLGRHLITKGPQGILSLGKFVPMMGSIVGSIVGGGFDWLFCHQGIDYADKRVFAMRYKGEEQLRNFLAENGFDDEMSLVDEHRFDASSICDLSKADMKELGIPLGRAFKLLKALSSTGGLCALNGDEL
mmetsp:Transcript_127219/g.360060  ORF Transcript_127219/g.360060 Transcript_127219/m.360060 type:complete len:311 (+) Transcript_127219:63-995(+)